MVTGAEVDEVGDSARVSYVLQKSFNYILEVMGSANGHETKN